MVVLIYVIPIGPSASINNDYNDQHRDLTSLERELVGTWELYYEYDGSTQYLVFNIDRTACEWIDYEDSSSRQAENNWVYWEIDEANPIKKNQVNVIVIWLGGVSSDYTYDYQKDEIWPSSYKNLSLNRASTNESCK